MRQATGLYTVLGVAPDSDPIVIEAAYRALMKKYHPDRFSGDPAQAERKAKQLNAAYAMLRDPDSRRLHDEALKASNDPALGWDWRYGSVGGPPAFQLSDMRPASSHAVARPADGSVVRQGLKLLAGTVGILVTGIWLIISDGTASPAFSAQAFPAGVPGVPSLLSGRTARRDATLPSIPEAIRGTWAATPEQCAPASRERVRLAADRIDFWDSSGRVRRVMPASDDGAYRVDLGMAGDRRAWSARFDLRPSGNGALLRVSRDDGGFDSLYVRCGVA